MRTPAGIFIYPSSVAALTILSILRPVMATLRLCFALASIICWTRCTLEENVAIMTRFLGCVAKTLAREVPTVFSEGVWPGRSALVDSHISISTPRRPSSPKRTMSIISPSIGVVSSLKSPVCKIVPKGVCRAMAQASAMEWLTWINSAEMLPSFTVSPAFTTRRSGFLGNTCSSSL